MERPPWVDPTLYPFQSRWLDTGRGRMHYVDEGRGPTLLLVHGTPTWSFLYRRVIRDLSRDHRVVAPDHLGLGLSGPSTVGDLTPADHAAALATLIEALELRDLAMAVHDFGGPIGLAWALDHPDRVRGLILLNTWMWSLAGHPAVRSARVLGGPLGRVLYQWLNLSPRFLLPSVFGDRSKLDRTVHRHYVAPFPDRRSRRPLWVLARELLGSGSWYEALWERREALAGRPALLLWGMEDPTFGPDALERWQTALPGSGVRGFPGVGHFVLEEEPTAAVGEMRSFLEGLRG